MPFAQLSPLWRKSMRDSSRARRANGRVGSEAWSGLPKRSAWECPLGGNALQELADSEALVAALARFTGPHELSVDSEGTCPASLAHALAARTAPCGRFRMAGAPMRNHDAIRLSNIMQPNAEFGMNGQMGLPHK